MAVAGKSQSLKIHFLPYFTTSHLLPLIDIARLFASRSISVTIITTPCNAQLFKSAVDHQNLTAGNFISVHLLKFPSQEVNLPAGIENFSSITSPEMSFKIYQAIHLLQIPIQNFFRQNPPDCIISDMFFPWTVQIAEELKIPRILFNPSNFFYHCISHSINIHSPYKTIESDNESFIVPDFPNEISITKSQLPDYVKTKTRYGELMNLIKESEIQSFGTVINTFLELEPDYVHHFHRTLGRKGWHLGPVSYFCNKLFPSRSVNSGDHESLKFLDIQKPNSVLYICFGSMMKFSKTQLTEIALALKNSGNSFIWVIGKGKNDEFSGEDFLPENFEKEINGMIIRDWAPQVLILDHPSIGGFMTHCGWNSVMEAITAGVPLITWPLFAEQFYNEKLITQVLKIGAEVGAVNWNSGFDISGPVIGKEKIEKAVRVLMGCSEEGERMREKAKELGLMARKAVEEGGSSDCNLTALIDELKAIAAQ